MTARAVWYRPHRGSLGASMAEACRFSTLAALRDHVGDQKAITRIFDDRPDQRISWARTCIVISGDGMPLGFTDDLFPDGEGDNIRLQRVVRGYAPENRSVVATFDRVPTDAEIRIIFAAIDRAFSDSAEAGKGG